MRKKFLVAPDSYKGSLTALEACEAISQGIKNVLPDAEVVSVPMADGGEGTVQSLVDATEGTLKTLEVVGPLGTPVTATYGILGDGTTAVIEMAEASGIGYVNKETKNPLITTTYGTGQLILACINQGINEIILGIGGSATNDGGAGMAQALGYQLLDEAGNEISYGGGALDQLHRIQVDKVDEKLKNVQFIVASDVNNPLCGVDGAANVFGPQKGATKDMINQLDANLAHYASIIKRDLDHDIKDLPGAGAAGGLGAGLMAFTNAEMHTGIEVVLAYSNFKEQARGCDICFTGEGSIDFQTKFGKTPYGVAQAFKAIHPDKKVIAIAGTIGDHIEELYEVGIDAIFSSTPRPATIEELIEDAARNLTQTTENIVRAIV